MDDSPKPSNSDADVLDACGKLVTAYYRASRYGGTYAQEFSHSVQNLVDVYGEPVGWDTGSHPSDSTPRTFTYCMAEDSSGTEACTYTADHTSKHSFDLEEKARVAGLTPAVTASYLP